MTHHFGSAQRVIPRPVTWNKSQQNSILLFSNYLPTNYLLLSHLLLLLVTHSDAAKNNIANIIHKPIFNHAILVTYMSLITPHPPCCLRWVRLIRIHQKTSFYKQTSYTNLYSTMLYLSPICHNLYLSLIMPHPHHIKCTVPRKPNSSFAISRIIICISLYVSAEELYVFATHTRQV